MDTPLLDEIKARVLPFLVRENVELVDLLVNRGRRRLILRFLVDKPGGITLDECARLNKEIGRLIEQEEIIQQSYVLEVSSPGLDRPLVSTKDFQRCLGQLARIVLHQPINGENVWTGFIDAVDENDVVIRTSSQDPEKLSIARKNIARARLEIES